MNNKRQLNSEMLTLRSIQEIVGAYEEIAAMRMRKVKKSVLQNRDFISGLNNIYQRVWYTYQFSKHTQAKKYTSILSTNSKTVSVLISANTGLYGDIIKKTFKLFIKNVKDSNTDVVILGKVGRNLLQDSGEGINYQYYDISDSGIERDSLRPILDYILTYSNIVVYHGMYVSVLTQKPISTYVTGEALNLKEKETKDVLKCLIEPTVEEVTLFFEKQILSTIFEQSMYEGSLSKFASRMISLDMASDNIQKYIKKVQFQMLKFRHKLNNTKQLERISGIALWDK